MNKSSKQTASSSLFVGVFDLRDSDVGYVVKTCLYRALDKGKYEKIYLGRDKL